MKRTILITAIIGLMLIPALTGKAASRWVETTSIGSTNIMGITSLALDEAWAVMGQTRWYFGNNSDTPVPADYSRTNYKDTIGIFRPSTGLWSWPAEGGRVYFGGSGDVPVTR